MKIQWTDRLRLLRIRIFEQKGIGLRALWSARPVELGRYVLPIRRIADVHLCTVRECRRGQLDVRRLGSQNRRCKFLRRVLLGERGIGRRLCRSAFSVALSGLRVFVGDAVNRAVGVVTDEERAVVSDREAERPPDVPVFAIGRFASGNR